MSTIVISVICLNLGVARLVVGVVAGLDLEDGEGEHDGHGVGHRDPPRDDLQYVILQFEFRAYPYTGPPPPRCRSRCRTCAGTAET